MDITVDLNLVSNRAMDALQEDLFTRGREAQEALTRHMNKKFRGRNYYREFDRLDQARQRIIRQRRALDRLMAEVRDR